MNPGHRCPRWREAVYTWGLIVLVTLVAFLLVGGPFMLCGG